MAPHRGFEPRRPVLETGRRPATWDREMARTVRTRCGLFWGVVRHLVLESGNARGSHAFPLRDRWLKKPPGDSSPYRHGELGLRRSIEGVREPLIVNGHDTGCRYAVHRVVGGTEGDRTPCTSAL